MAMSDQEFLTVFPQRHTLEALELADHLPDVGAVLAERFCEAIPDGSAIEAMRNDRKCTTLGRVDGFEQDEGRGEYDDGPEVFGGLLAA